MKNDINDIAVATDFALLTRQMAISLPCEPTLSNLATLAYAYDLRAIWIAPGSLLDRRSRERAFWQHPAGTWRVFATGATQESPSHAIVSASSSLFSVEVFGDVANRWYLDLSDPERLLLAIEIYEHSLDQEAHISPAQSGLALLRRTCATPARHGWLAPITDPVYRTIEWPQERGLSHTNHTPRDGKYIHVYDKRFAFGAACLHEFGSGDPIFMQRDFDIDGILAGKVYGLWRVFATPPSDATPALPSPWAASEPIPAGDWFYTPQLVLAHRMGWKIEIVEGWMWPAKHKIMEDWVRQMWNARRKTERSFIAPLVKATFNRARGAMRYIPDDTPKWYHRPDWNCTIAAVHYLRQMLSILSRERQHPGYLAVRVDSIAWISNEPDPWLALPILRNDPWMMGSYRHVCSYSGDAAQEIIRRVRAGEKAYNVMESIDALHGEDASIQADH